MCVVTHVSIQRYKDTLECSWWFSDFLGDQSLFIAGGGGGGGWLEKFFFGGGN